MSDFFNVYEDEYKTSYQNLIQIYNEYNSCDSKNDKDLLESYETRFKDLYSSLDKMLKDMEMEIRTFSSSDKRIFSEKIRGYKNELLNLQSDFNKKKFNYSTAFLDDGTKSSRDKKKMLEGNERLRQQNELLDRVQMTVLETEQIGAETLVELQRNREVIESATLKTKEMNAETAKSESILKRMTRRDWSLGFFS